VVWNDRDGDRFVCRVLDVKTRKLRTLPRPVGHLSPDGKLALCEDYSRIWNFRAGYGYAGLPTPTPRSRRRRDRRLADGPRDRRIAALVSVADLVRSRIPANRPTTSTTSTI